MSWAPGDIPLGRRGVAHWQSGPRSAYMHQARLRAEAETVIRQLHERWDSDDRRRGLPPDLVRKTERHARRWVIIRDGRYSGSYGRISSEGTSDLGFCLLSG